MSDRQSDGRVYKDALDRWIVREPDSEWYLVVSAGYVLYMKDSEVAYARDWESLLNTISQLNRALVHGITGYGFHVTAL